VAGGTRTCIHTPGPPLSPDEITDAAVEAALDGTALVFFDGRLTEAALKLAEAANQRRLPLGLLVFRLHAASTATGTALLAMHQQQTRKSVRAPCKGKAYFHASCTACKARQGTTVHQPHGCVREGCRSLLRASGCAPT